MVRFHLLRTPLWTVWCMTSGSNFLQTAFWREWIPVSLVWFGCSCIMVGEIPSAFSIVSESYNSHIFGFSVFPNSLVHHHFPILPLVSNSPQDHLYVYRHRCSVFWSRGGVGGAGAQNLRWSQMITWRMFRKFPGVVWHVFTLLLCIPIEWRHRVWTKLGLDYSRGLQTSFIVYLQSYKKLRWHTDFIIWHELQR